MKRYYIIIVFLLVLMSSCTKKDNSNFLQAKNKLYNMKSYSAVAHITVYGNKGVSYYKVAQYCVLPEKIRIETIEPNFLKGKITVYKDGKWKVYHPLINKTFEIDNLRSIDQIIYLGIIQKDLFIDKSARYKNISKNGTDYIKIENTIPGESEYGKTAVLYLERISFNPALLEILDNEEKVKVKVEYEGFEYNKKLDNSIFLIN